MKKQNRLSRLEEISMIEVQNQNLENEFQLCLSEKRQVEKYYRSREGIFMTLRFLAILLNHRRFY